MLSKTKTVLVWASMGLILVGRTLNVSAQASSDGPQLLDRIIAVVDREIILLSELQWNLQMEIIQQRLDIRRDAAKIEVLEEYLFENMVNDAILLAKARADTVLVSSREVEDALKEELASLKEQYGTEEYARMLRQQSMTEKDIRDRRRRDIRNYLLKQGVIESLGRNITVSYKDVADFYEAYRDSLPEKPEQVHISHIMLRVKPGEEKKAEVRQRLMAILERAKAGEDFAELAKQYSEDIGSAQNGGDLGFFEKNTMVPVFEKAAFSLEPGEISDIIETQFGYHIIKVEEKTPRGVRARHILMGATTTSEDEPQIIEQLNMLRKRVLEGEDFAELARGYSEYEASASIGGMLGWYQVDNLPEDFKPVVDALKPGEVSAPVKSEQGYHIICLNEREEGGSVTIEHDRETLERMVHQQRLSEAIEEALDRERERIYMDVKPKDSWRE